MLARSTTAVLAGMIAESNFSDGGRAETLVSRRGRSCCIIHIGICHGDESALLVWLILQVADMCVCPLRGMCAHTLRDPPISR